MRQQKKLSMKAAGVLVLACFIAVMALGTMTVRADSYEDWLEEYATDVDGTYTLTLDETLTIDIPSGAALQYTFTPEADGQYTFDMQVTIIFCDGTTIDDYSMVWERIPYYLDEDGKICALYPSGDDGSSVFLSDDDLFDMLAGETYYFYFIVDYVFDYTEEDAPAQSIITVTATCVDSDDATTTSTTVADDSSSTDAADDDTADDDAAATTAELAAADKNGTVISVYSSEDAAAADGRTDGYLVITASTETVDLTDADISAIIEAQIASDTDASADEIEVLEVVEVYYVGDESALDFPLTLTFKADGVTAENFVGTLHKVDGVWTAEEASVETDGSVVVTVNSLSPFAFLVSSTETEENSTTAEEEEGATTSATATTESSNQQASNTADVSVWVYLVILAGAVVGAVVIAKRRVEE
ncbi:MAG: hypothetical protein LUE29_10140 [Lachnospiraceae bacterium]|nr:hypothetical protein [Lachnospiraceae bacterium]